MPNPSKRKGSQFEREVANFLRDHGHPYAERAYGAGRPDDRGDIDGLPGWCLEVKNHRALELSAWSDEAEVERANGRRRFGAVIFKRRNRPTGDAYVLLSLATFAELLADDDTTERTNP